MSTFPILDALHLHSTCDLLSSSFFIFFFFFFNDTATTEIYTLPLHAALPIYRALVAVRPRRSLPRHGSSRSARWRPPGRSEEHTSELQSRLHLVCRLLLEKKKKNTRSS